MEKEVNLIDMEKVLSELCLSHKDIIYIDKNETAERIRKIPSIDIVFCKECKWRGEQTESGIPYYWCRLVGVGYEVPIEHYCSYGERSE